MVPTLGALMSPSPGRTPGRADSLGGSARTCLRSPLWAATWEPRASGWEGEDGSRPAFSLPGVTEFWRTGKGGLPDFRCGLVLERERNGKVPFQ